MLYRRKQTRTHTYVKSYVLRKAFVVNSLEWLEHFVGAHLHNLEIQWPKIFFNYQTISTKK